MKSVKHEYAKNFVLLRIPSWTNLIDGVVHPSKIIEVYVVRVVENNYFIQHPMGTLMIELEGNVYYPLSDVIGESVPG